MSITGSTVGWDASNAADRAVRWAAERAARRVGALHLVRVLDSASLTSDPAAAVRQARRDLDEECSVVGERYPGVYVGAEIRVGERAAELASACRGGVLVIGASDGGRARDPSSRALPLALASRGEGVTVIVPAGPPAERHGVFALVQAGGRSIGTATFAAQEAVESGESLTLVRVVGPVGSCDVGRAPVASPGAGGGRGPIPGASADGGRVVGARLVECPSAIEPRRAARARGSPFRGGVIAPRPEPVARVPRGRPARHRGGAGRGPRPRPGRGHPRPPYPGHLTGGLSALSGDRHA